MNTLTHFVETSIPRKTLRSHARTLMLSLAAFAAIQTTQADVIYRQNYGNASGTPGTGDNFQTFSSVGWNLLAADNGGDVFSPIPAYGYYLGIYNYQGIPTNLGNINAPASASDEYGISQIFNTDGFKFQSLVYTDQYEIDQSAYDISSISYYAYGTSGGTPGFVRAAVQIDGTWYVTSSTSYDTIPTQYTIDFDTTSWFTLTAAVGAPFSVSGSPVSLPGGTIEAFGWFGAPRADLGGSTLRLDTYTINATAIPEPSAATLSLLSLGISVLAYRRRSKRVLNA